jgi:hypothetical protein
VQDELAASIAEKLRNKLAGAGPPPSRKCTPRIDAYEALPKAWHYQWTFAQGGLEKGRECYELAIRLDPGFALAYSG